MDIQLMRSDKLGYNAPIIKEKKYYVYEDPDYTIEKTPLSKADLEKLSEAIDILKHFKGFNHFQHMSGIIQGREDRVNSAGWMDVLSFILKRMRTFEVLNSSILSIRLLEANR